MENHHFIFKYACNGQNMAKHPSKCMYMSNLCQFPDCSFDWRLSHSYPMKSYEIPMNSMVESPPARRMARAMATLSLAAPLSSKVLLPKDSTCRWCSSPGVIGTSPINGPCSIAMFNYRRIKTHWSQWYYIDYSNIQ